MNTKFSEAERLFAASQDVQTLRQVVALIDEAAVEDETGCYDMDMEKCYDMLMTALENGVEEARPVMNRIWEPEQEIEED